ncbi:MAG: PLP-dependent aminotransferase family protein [Granulosicoccus sp.]
MHQGLSRRIQRLKASPIRDMLREIEKPGMISLAGGLPATASLPKFDDGISTASLQYGASEGDLQLRELIATELRMRGLDADAERVIVLSGSQQGIDLVAKLAIDEGTPVAVESPTYLAALQTFSLFGANFLPFDVDKLDAAFTQTKPLLLYVNPTFRNPDSVVYDAMQRERLAATCDALDTIVFEDDPYRDLAYESCERTPVCAGLQRSNWVYQSSFSKTIAPGLRLGYLLCSKQLYTPLLRLKQATDLHSNRLSQQLVVQLLKDDANIERVSKICEDYCRRRDCLDELLHRYFGHLAHWRRPAGGLFFWLKLQAPRTLDTRQLLLKALVKGVAFMPGEPFYCDGRRAASALRLNFTHADPREFEPALEILAALVNEELQRKCP